MYFQTKGHPDIRQDLDGPYIKCGDVPHLLTIETYQHYLEYRGRKIKLTAVRNYQWLREEVKEASLFFDVANSFCCDLDLIFEYLQEQQLNVWENRPDLSDDAFYEKLADVMWFFAQTTPLKEGSAAASLFIMKFCLIKRFGENAPLFLKPGLSIDFIAMLTKREDFKKIFKSLLRMSRPLDAEIEEGRKTELNTDTVNAMNTKYMNQIYMKKTNQHITEELRDTGLFILIEDELTLTHSYDKNIQQSVAFCQEMKKQSFLNQKCQ